MAIGTQSLTPAGLTGSPGRLRARDLAVPIQRKVPGDGSAAVVGYANEVITSLGPASSLIDGYQLPFLTGAGTIAIGIALAVALLRPGTPQRGLNPAERDTALAPDTFDLERQAA
jgi:hypothetical protein